MFALALALGRLVLGTSGPKPYLLQQRCRLECWRDAQKALGDEAWCEGGEDGSTGEQRRRVPWCGERRGCWDGGGQAQSLWAVEEETLQLWRDAGHGCCRRQTAAGKKGPAGVTCGRHGVTERGASQRWCW